MSIGMLSDQVEAALRQAVLMACDEAIAIAQEDKAHGDPHPRLSTWNWPAAVFSIVGSAVRERVAACQADLAVSRVPKEVLIAIFDLLETSERACSTQVCKSWNKILLGTPTLWNRVDFMRDSPPHAVAAYVRLSGDVPLEKLHVTICDKNLPAICSVLQQHVKRTRRLAVAIDRLSDVDGNDPSLRLLHYAFTSPAPLLEQCRIYDNYYSWDPFIFSENMFHLFSGHAPRLQMVKLANFHYKLQFSASTLVNVTQGLFGGTDAIATRIIQQALDLCPALAHLGIELSERNNNSDTQTALRVSLPPRLVELCIIIQEVVDSVQLLRSIDYSSLSRLLVANASAGHIEPLLELFRHELEPIRTIALRTALNDDNEVLLDVRMYQQEVPLHIHTPYNLGVKERSLLELVAALGTRLSRVPHLFIHLRTLYVQEPQFHHALLVASGDTIEIPSLEKLIVTLAGPVGIGIAGHESIFFPPNSTDAPLWCPKLQSLRIATPHATEMLIDPGLVLMFLNRWIKFDEPQLIELILHGTRLFEGNVAHIAQLLEKFERFIVVDGPMKLNCADSNLLHWG